jgi:hypothetical protein
MSDIKLNNVMTQHLPTNNTATACTNLYTNVHHVIEYDTWANRNCEINLYSMCVLSVGWHLKSPGAPVSYL